jgi:hypothetical protein
MFGCKIERDGFEVLRGAIPKSVVHRIVAEVERSSGAEGILSADLICILWRMVPALRAAVVCVRPALERLLDAAPLITQAVLLDKNAGRNWSLPMHQDVYVYVSTAPGEPQSPTRRVRAPDHVLRSMLVMRLHLDDCSVTSGGLRIIPGTHFSLQDACLEQSKMVTIDQRSGDVLLMRPLVVHDSPFSTVATQRRVVHLSFIPRALKTALSWQDCFDPWRSASAMEV